MSRYPSETLCIGSSVLANVSYQAVSEGVTPFLMRHKDPRITSETYLQLDSDYDGGGESSSAGTLTLGPFMTERDIGVEPTTFSLGTDSGSVGGSSTVLQSIGITENHSKGDLQAAGTKAANGTDFVPIVSPEIQLSAVGGSRRAAAQESKPLLSVKEVARRLGIATATVYGLCAEGLLAHVRILNVIKVTPSDLDGFVASRRSARPRR